MILPNNSLRPTDNHEHDPSTKQENSPFFLSYYDYELHMKNTLKFGIRIKEYHLVLKRKKSKRVPFGTQKEKE
jgi:hypothetical protein